MKPLKLLTRLCQILFLNWRYKYIMAKTKEEEGMSAFIARAIEKARDKSLEKGQAKYRAYFVKTNLYRDWQSDVDTILETDGYEDCIVEE